MSEIEKDAKRYRTLKAYLIALGHFVPLESSESEPFTMDGRFYGDFDAAVDSLPEQG